jgi:hypothetical protein
VFQSPDELKSALCYETTEAIRSRLIGEHFAPANSHNESALMLWNFLSAGIEEVEQESVLTKWLKNYHATKSERKVKGNAAQRADKRRVEMIQVLPPVNMRPLPYQYARLYSELRNQPTEYLSNDQVLIIIRQLFEEEGYTGDPGTFWRIRLTRLVQWRMVKKVSFDEAVQASLAKAVKL